MVQIPPSGSSPDPDEDSGESAQPWDELRWEAFLQEGDRRTEEYMALLDMFGDEPDGHNIIAGAMGWEHLKTLCGKPPTLENCSACARREECPFHQLDEAGLIPDASDEDSTDEAPPDEGPSFEVPEVDGLFERDADETDDLSAEPGELDAVMDHPLVEAAARATTRAHELLEGESDPTGRGPASRLRSHLAACCGKLAAGLGDDEFDLDVLGLSIAYLKRAHRRLCLALGALSELQQEMPEKRDDLAGLRRCIEALRDQVAAHVHRFRTIFRNGTMP